MLNESRGIAEERGANAPKSGADTPIGFRKLRPVEIARGEIRGEWAEIEKTGSGYWRPFEDYYKNGTKHYMALYNCGTDEASVKRFMENYGPITQDLSADRRKGSFSLANFLFERWCFRFAVALHGLIRNPNHLRDVFIKAVKDVQENTSNVQNNPDVLPRFHRKPGKWYQVFARIRDVTGATPNSPKNERGLVDSAGLAKMYEDVCQRIRKTRDERIVAAAQRYLMLEVNERLKQAWPLFRFTDGNSSRLSANCRDLLTAFYYMLATDWSQHRAPVFCAVCGEPFTPESVDATYCRKRKCKEIGRKRLNWARHGAKYVRTRRKKRQKERRQKL
jgi:hypothetical protein